MKLIDTIKLDLDPLHVEKIALIDNFDFSKTAKKVNQDFGGLTSNYLREGIANLKKYYVVALLDPKNMHAVSRYVDPFWHAHVLYTRDYMDFCNAVFEQYVHHEPADLGNVNETKELMRLYSYTKSIYEKMFVSVDQQWWPGCEAVDFGHAFSPILCKHYFITNEEIYQKALFPKQDIELYKVA